MARRKKPLSKDDRAVWEAVAKTLHVARPIRKQVPMDLGPEPQEAEKPPVRKHPVVQKTEARPITPFRIGQNAQSVSVRGGAPDFNETRSDRSPRMDKRNFQRLIKGQMEIDATLDLHGLSAEQARLRCHQFIKSAHSRGHRMVLVITGKGRSWGRDEFNRPKGGVIRSSFPDWLRGPSLSHLVVQATQASRKHGGEGAFYVYLRRKR